MPVSRSYKIKSDKMMVCPLHDDINPSMGIVIGKSGEELFHCFGCNRWGNIVKLHKGVSMRLFNKHLNDNDSLKELCSIFNVPFDTFSEVEENNSESSDDIKIELAVKEGLNKFELYDFRRLMTEGKIKKKPIGYFNTITMMMVNELNS